LVYWFPIDISAEEPGIVGQLPKRKIVHRKNIKKTSKDDGILEFEHTFPIVGSAETLANLYRSEPRNKEKQISGYP